MITPRWIAEERGQTNRKGYGMLKIQSEKVPQYGNRLRVANQSYDEYEWIIDHLSDEIRGHSPNVYGLRDSAQNRRILKKLLNAHGVEVEFL